MELHHFLRFGYILVVAVFILMVWVSLTSSTEYSASNHPPCFFNPMCTCSKAVPDLGIVQCINNYFPRIPRIINASKVFALHMENNGLEILEPYFFRNSGLCKLKISHNHLVHVSDESFVGLERTLWELDLAYNHLNRIPTKAVKYLRKLKSLDLSGNEINFIAPEHLKGLDFSLEKLVLAKNSIAHLPPDTFSGLPHLRKIDLTENHLRQIDPSVFRDGMDSLEELILADNQLSFVPYQALAPLKSLRTLDLSYNMISKVQPSDVVGSQELTIKMYLDLLRLEYNQIEVLVSGSFINFAVVNKTYLDGNPLRGLQVNAFQQAKIRELYIRKCGLTEVMPESFNGLEGSLVILDLSGNNLTGIQDNVFQGLERMSLLSLRDNPLSGLNPREAFNGFQFSLHRLDLSLIAGPIVLQDIRWLRNARELSLSRLSRSFLSVDDFIEFGIDLEKVQISAAGLKELKNHCFRHVHALREIDLSDNNIDVIEKDAFAEVHSLLKLKLAHALSSSFQTLPGDSLKPLINLEYLDLSNNRLKNVPNTSFYFLKRLETVMLQDNVIEVIQKGTFQADVHTRLATIFLSFNNIRNIQQHTFVDLDSLEQLHLDDNRIEHLERRSFMNLPSLKRLNLKGNKISTIDVEAFQNLPATEDLDISYNSLNKLDLSYFDQVGTLSMFSLNVSHNKIPDLRVNVDANFNDEPGSVSPHANVKTLDLSYNNISYISQQFFLPVELSLITLILSHNALSRATSDVFGRMTYLERFDLSHNKLFELEQDTFKNVRRLQIFSCAFNHLEDVPSELFRGLQNLRVVDMSHNRLKTLPDSLFREDGLESLDLSHNELTRLPLTSMTVAAANTICTLDLSHNGISAVTNGGLFNRLKNLRSLDLSHNRLIEIDTGVFAPLPKITTLNLGHNPELVLGRGGAAFQGIEDVILHLNLDNISLSEVPDLPLPNLVSLSLAYNSLPSVPPEMAAGLNSLRNLDLSFNDLTTVPTAINSLFELRRLSLAANPITVLADTSFAGVADSLEELDIRNLELNTFEKGVFSKMHFLRTLRISSFGGIKGFNIPEIVQENWGLQTLEVHSTTETSLLREMEGYWPYKLRNVTFSGKGLKSLGTGILEGIRSPFINLGIHRTSISKVPAGFLQNIGRVENITIDVRDNSELQHLQNPSSGSRPGLRQETFLINLLISGHKWNCDCDVGWVEVWLRKKRQYLCGPSPSVLNPQAEANYRCRHAEDGLRNSFCHNKVNQSLIDVLKTDIECGWSSGVMQLPFKYAIIGVVCILLALHA